MTNRVTDVLIIGSGISAVGAALGLSPHGLIPEILDVGHEAALTESVKENFYDLGEARDVFELMIGNEFEGTQNLRHGVKYLPAKLVAPRFRFVCDGAAELAPLEEQGFSSVQSFAKGGLGNAWGAGVYRYTERDLRGFPLSVSDLDPFYNELTEEIGISGISDDLSPYFGSEYALQPPLRLSLNSQRIFRTYEKKRKWFLNQGVHVGRPRLAILSQDKNGRHAHRYQNLEFWQPHLPEIYSPAYTLDRLIQSKKVVYNKGFLVHSICQTEGCLHVSARELESGKERIFAAKRVVLAAGAIGSAKILLRSFGDFETELPLHDNPGVQLPLVLPGRMGAPLERESSGLTQLNMVFDQGWGTEPLDYALQSSLLDISSPARAEFFGRFPLRASANLSLMSLLLPAMMVNYLFLPSDAHGPARLRLKPSGEIQIRGEEVHIERKIVDRLVRVMRTMGALSHRALAVHVPNGGGIHYAGTLAMSSAPKTRYQSLPTGELPSFPGVYVADGSALPTLPAKNHSFTLMANAMRVGNLIGHGFHGVG
jgi:choline dehydrogenase-like flavoprotein